MLSFFFFSELYGVNYSVHTGQSQRICSFTPDHRLTLALDTQSLLSFSINVSCLKNVLLKIVRLCGKEYST